MGIRYLEKVVRQHNTTKVSLPQKTQREILVDGDLLSYLYDNSDVTMHELESRYESLLVYLKSNFKDVIVYFDGSSETCKVETSRRRRKRRAGQKSSRRKLIPITKMILKQVIRKLDITIRQCWGEADGDLALEGQHSDKVVLSRDTDFLCMKTNIIFYDKLEESRREDHSEVSYVDGTFLDVFFQLKSEQQRNWLPRILGALTPNDYVEPEVLLWAYDNLYPGISLRQFKQMSEHDDKNCFSGQECRRTKLASVSLVDSLRSLAEILPLKVVTQSDIDAVVEHLRPPEDKKKKVADSLRQFFPEVTPAVATHYLPESFVKNYAEGLIDCDFSDMYLSNSKEWWSDPLPERGIGKKSFYDYYLNVRQKLYGLVHSDSEEIKEYIVRYGVDSTDYVDGTIKPVSVIYKSNRITLGDLWGVQGGDTRETRVGVASIIAGIDLGLAADCLSSVVMLMLRCTPIDLRPCEWRALLDATKGSEFRKKEAQDPDDDAPARPEFDETEYNRSRAIFCSFTSALIHMNYICDVTRLRDFFHPFPIPCYPSMMDYYVKYHSDENNYGGYEDFVSGVMEKITDFTPSGEFPPFISNSRTDISS
eukprot:TRINITY_DN5142_c0_g1_i1.p1 TRINITY_DN5142_c0_g1~~TRINITY_DN5142_c0_g1_i1.p1  ORF type:complete len:593 (+),score=50.65 TRINITY_DN5142_c0_g1_i1:43-1821(+)